MWICFRCLNERKRTTSVASLPRERTSVVKPWLRDRRPTAANAISCSSILLRADSDLSSFGIPWNLCI